MIRRKRPGRQRLTLAQGLGLTLAVVATVTIGYRSLTERGGDVVLKKQNKKLKEENQRLQLEA